MLLFLMFQEKMAPLLVPLIFPWKLVINSPSSSKASDFVRYTSNL